jgi:probable blue pigment (indigoidine) exporter
MSRDLRVACTTTLTPIVWGTTYLVATEMLPPGRPWLAATIRALPVGLVFVLRTRVLPTGVWWWRALALGTLNIGAFFALLFVAAFRLPGGVAATAGAIQPLLAALIAVVALGERLTRRAFVASVMGMAGVALLVLQPSARLDTVGLIAALAGTVSMASGVVLTKRWGRPVDLVTFTGWQLAIGGLMLLPLTLAIEGLPEQLSTRNALGFVWIAVVGTGLAYVNWFRGIALLPIGTTSLLVLISPLVATIAGWIVLDQRLEPAQIGGAMLVATAVASPHLAGRHQPKIITSPA